MPTLLSHGVSQNTVHGLDTGARHIRLAFRGPGYQVVAKVDTITRGGAASVRAACPVCVGVRCEGGGLRGVELESEVEGAGGHTAGSA
jgi:hypothetical protein